MISVILLLLLLSLILQHVRRAFLCLSTLDHQPIQHGKIVTIIVALLFMAECGFECARASITRVVAGLPRTGPNGSARFRNGIP